MKTTDLPPATIDREEMKRRYMALPWLERVCILSYRFEDRDKDNPATWEDLARLVEHFPQAMVLRAKELEDDTLANAKKWTGYHAG